MRSMLFATVATFGLCLGAAAMAQTTNDNMATPSAALQSGHIPGVGLSEPASTSASNISPSDTSSPIAPRLPGSAMPGTETTVNQELQRAQEALSAHRTGAAQEALERAETRLLDRSTPAGTTNIPDTGPTVSTIAQARQALGHNDLSGAQSLISKAMMQTAG
jgi:cytoskeletal protein RodZ